MKKKPVLMSTPISTNAQITELVPGWNKLAGRAAKATFRLINRDGVIKLEDVNVAGSGVQLRGTVELDNDGNLNDANFTTFQFSDGDRANFAPSEQRWRATGKSCAARCSMRAGYLRSLSPRVRRRRTRRRKSRATSISTFRLGAATGNNGEVIRNLELRVARRNGEIRAFALIGKVGRDSSIVGELRARDGGRPVIYVTAGDAGALFRFADYYSKIQGGEIWIVLDTPRNDNAPQEGIVSVRNFNIVGEPNLDRLIAAAQRLPRRRISRAATSRAAARCRSSACGSISLARRANSRSRKR